MRESRGLWRRAGGRARQSARHAANVDDATGAAQSQVGQKLQSISAHEPFSFRFARQIEVQNGSAPVFPQRSAMYWTFGCPAHFPWTATSHSEQMPTTSFSSQARNWPPPQTQAIWGSHLLGHQQASVRGLHLSLAAMHAQALSVEHSAVVVVEPSGLFKLPPQPSRPAAAARTATPV